jgi:cation:H+ antiporter
MVGPPSDEPIALRAMKHRNCDGLETSHVSPGALRFPTSLTHSETTLMDIPRDSILTQALLLVAGLTLIVKGGDMFVGAAVRIAGFLRMPRVVIGSTLVSLATTSPELVVSIMAGTKGESELAVGNAVGSCVCNIGLILGVTAAIKQIDVHPKSIRVPLFALFSFAVLLFAMMTDLTLSPTQGGLLVALGLGYFIFDFVRHSCDTKPADIAEAIQIEEAIEKRSAWLETKWGTAAQFFTAACIVVVGSKLLVDAAVNVAGAMGIPSIIIGLTVVAVGTSLPEFITALTSSRKAVSDLAVGNILGANIANLSLIVGTAALLHEVKIDRPTELFNFPALLISLLLLVYVIHTDNRVTRRQGALLLSFYGLYIGALIALTLIQK